MSFWSRGTLAYNSIARAADLLASARAYKYEQIPRNLGILHGPSCRNYLQVFLLPTTEVSSLSCPLSDLYSI